MRIKLMPDMHDYSPMDGCSLYRTKTECNGSYIGDGAMTVIQPTTTNCAEVTPCYTTETPKACIWKKMPGDNFQQCIAADNISNSCTKDSDCVFTENDGMGNSIKIGGYYCDTRTNKCIPNTCAYNRCASETGGKMSNCTGNQHTTTVS